MKKFKVRISHFAEGKYTVQYAHYNFFPNWKSLNFWFDQGHPGRTQCWSINLWDVCSAEKVASNLKTIDDIKKYYEPFEREAAAWCLEEKKYWEKNVPYQTKEF